MIYLRLGVIVAETMEKKLNVTYLPRSRIDPLVVRRECGGWIATAPEGAGLRFGVLGDTEVEVREKFQQSLARWVESLMASA